MEANIANRRSGSGSVLQQGTANQKFMLSHYINDYYSGEKPCKFSSTSNSMGNGGARAPAHRGT